MPGWDLLKDSVSLLQSIIVDASDSPSWSSDAGGSDDIIHNASPNEEPPVEELYVRLLEEGLPLDGTKKYLYNVC